MVFSLIARFVGALVVRAILGAGKPVNNRNRDLYPKIGFTSMRGCHCALCSLQKPRQTDRSRVFRINSI
jgi:hypothetical protein